MKATILTVLTLATFSTIAYSKPIPAPKPKPASCRSLLMKYTHDMENPNLYKSNKMFEQYLNLKANCIIKDKDDFGYACRELYIIHRDNLKLYTSLIHQLGKDSFEMLALKDSNDATLEALLDGCVIE